MCCYGAGALLGFAKWLTAWIAVEGFKDVMYNMFFTAYPAVPA